MATDRDALRKLASISNIGEVHWISHYLYLPTETAGKCVADELSMQGFVVDDRMDPYDGSSWLVLAKRRMTPTEDAIAEARTFLEAIAARYNGEYDGWEVDVQPSDS